MNKMFLLVMTIVFLVVSGFAIDDARLLRFPDINKDTVAFVYAGDIWTVPATGGNAVRLTSHKGLELFPKISPDGKWIAFSGEYSGSRQIYIMPVEGGTPKQLTYYNDAGKMPPRGGFDHIPLDWTPDSQYILIRANRTPFLERMGKYFLVNREGGLEKPLQIPEAGFGSFSPDAKSIVYTPISREFRTWKRTKTGRAQDVWTYDLEKNVSKRITTFPGTDYLPSWYGNKIYYVSDQSLTLNFWCHNLATGEKKQITDFKEFDVLWPSGNGGKLAFEKGGYIHILNLDNNEVNKLAVNIHFDNPNRLPYFKNVADCVSRFGAGVSPDGERAVLDARGDLFTVPAKKGITVNLTQTQGIREMHPAWSPDGKWIAYVSDESGDYEIYLMDPKHPEKKIQLTTDHKVWNYNMVWSPDSSKLAFSDVERRLQILDIQTKALTLVDTGYYGTPENYHWSGDSSWLIYTKERSNRLSAMFVYSLDQKKYTMVSNGRYNDTFPVFSQDGKYIYFISDRDFNMSFMDNFSSMEFDFIYSRTKRIFALALTKDVADLFQEENDLEPKKEATADNAKEKDKKGKKSKDKSEKSSKTKVNIDFNGLYDRVMVFPLASEKYDWLRDLGEKLLYKKGNSVWQFDLKTKKGTSVIENVGDVFVSADNKKLFYSFNQNKYGIIDIGPGHKTDEGKLNLEDVSMKIDPLKEWQQIYNEGWRIYRDWFYVRNMHGVDWKKMKEKYAPLVPYLSHRADLDYIFGELVAELNVGHAYVNWGNFESVKRMDTGLLGAQMEADLQAKRYKITKIFKGENWNELTRSPLTAVGVNVKEGDYIIRLDGHDLTINDNPYLFLENKAGKRISITVNSQPKTEGARTYWIKTTDSELQLLHLDWVESRRQLVDRLSNGRIGYIYVPDTAMDGNRELFKGLYAFNDKEAFIIDDRYNGGGFTPEKMIQKLTQRIASYWGGRGTKLLKAPTFSLEGPKVMLINHYSSSGGDAFPWWFRHNKLGKLIGTRTWGGLVGYSWSAGLVDGPSFAVPMSGIVSKDGKYIVEGVGVYPDEGFEVYDRPEEIAKGNDPSIQKAVEYLLEQLEKNPDKVRVEPPADPDRSKWAEFDIK